MPNSGSHAAAASVDLAAEVERLRAMLDRLPSCLMRVATDGTLLAVSDAALTLLGARELAQVLDTNFVERLAAEGAAGEWAQFVDRVLRQGSGSAESILIDLDGVERAVILLGVALPDHPDDRRSLMVTVRDVSTAKRLEASLHEQEQLRRAIQDGLEHAALNVQELRAELQQSVTERDELRAALDAESLQRQQIAASLERLTHALSAAIDAAAVARQAIEKGPSS